MGSRQKELKMRTGILADEEFGQILLRYDPRAVRYIFRVKSGELQVTLPERTSEKEIVSVLEKKRGALRKLMLRVPDNKLTVGTVIETRCFNININTYRGNKILYTLHGALDVFVPAEADINDPLLSERIKKGIMRFVLRHAASYLKTRLDAAAMRLRLKYNTFAVSSGRRILGKCDTRRNIKLSGYLLFYPEDLIDYVIYHELAHLTVMNHGEAFHRLCDKYCSGKESELRNRLRRFPLPL